MGSIIRPQNAIPRTTGISAGFYASGGTPVAGWGPWLVKASITADEILELWFKMPAGALPTGTAKLDFIAVSSATSGGLDIRVKWKSFAVGESILNPGLFAETKVDLDWGGGDANVLKQSKISLTQDTLIVSELIIMHLTLEPGGTQPSVAVGFDASIIFE